MFHLIVNIFAAFFATIGFSTIFHVRTCHLITCGIVGSTGWTIYILFTTYEHSPVLATFVAAMVVSQLSSFLSRIKKAPITVFLIPGIIPLVPGIGLYRTMYYFFLNDSSSALNEALLAFQLSGVIAGAILLSSIISFLYTKRL